MHSPHTPSLSLGLLQALDPYFTLKMPSDRWGEWTGRSESQPAAVFTGCTYRSRGSHWLTVPPLPIAPWTSRMVGPFITWKTTSAPSPWARRLVSCMTQGSTVPAWYVQGPVQICSRHVAWQPGLPACSPSLDFIAGKAVNSSCNIKG